MHKHNGFSVDDIRIEHILFKKGSSSAVIATSILDCEIF